MTPDEFKGARRKLGLTQAQLGAILNTDPATIRRWEMAPDVKSARPPNPVACQVMAWMLGGYRPPEWPGEN
ncbi:helix-turn-helix domain-containing protein [Roseovarius atlanticus]|nr:helix-turn-helix domain-containing protein [Roseovarius atlanticus]MBY6123589.1 helix-turn-helix domain-containing protein [Roseovarius atlanticus]MBY6148084.1 helix-turn-helix domain-containing protein [Roseovarius atlanticus]